MSAVPASIIISSYNYEQFVGEAIASALAQDLGEGEVEVIVVDDGSDDGSRAVIAEFGERIVAIDKPNGGQASALNAGYQASRGETVLFLDADDLLLPGAARAAAEALADPQVAKAHWPMPIVDAAGARTGSIQDPDVVEGDLRADVLAEGPLCDATMPNPPMSGNAFARSFLDQVMPIPETPYFTAPDEYLFGLAPAFGRIVRLAPQSLYRFHGGNDHVGWSFERKLSFQDRHYAIVSEVAAEALRRTGREADRAAWDAAAWWKRAGRVVGAIERFVPAGGRLLLLDGGALGAEGDLRGRRVIPFPEQDGEYAGAPADDEEAVMLLERADSVGIDCVAVAFPAFWWLDEYPGVAHALRARRRTLAAGPDVLLFGPRSR